MTDCRRRTHFPAGTRIGQVWPASSIVLLAAIAAWAEMATVRIGSPPSKAPTIQPQTVRAKPPAGYVVETASPPKIDGLLDDAAWKKAETLALARTLDGSAAAAQPTEVRLLRDAKNLYVAFRCTEPLLKGMQVQKRAHDGQVWADDSVEVFLSPGDGYYHFIVNPAGSTYDGRGKDASWESSFACAAGRDKEGWTVEMAVPLASMAAQRPSKEWTANFNRARRAAGGAQESAWSPTNSDDSHCPERFGKLIFGPPPAGELVEVERPTVRKQALTVLPAEGGEGVVRFDLSGLPKGATIYRADLLIFRSAVITGAADAALVDIEIYPLLSAFQGGSTPQPSGKPLALRQPWCDRFDATEAVQQWMGGKTNGGFFVKTCPHWDAEGTCLEVAYLPAAGRQAGEGRAEAEKTPPQVAAVRAFHRAGQTFITWKEVQPLVTEDKLTYGEYKRILAAAEAPCRYRIYVHNRPIMAESIAQARLLAEVGPLSAYNVNGRNREYLIGQAMIAPDEMGELARDYNGEMSRWTMDSARMDRYPLQRFVIDEEAGPLPAGTGLYVHSPEAPGRRHYAVASVREGVENTRDFSQANATSQPLEETVGTGLPVRQGKGLWGPYFDYPGTRWVYVQWCAPPLSPRPNMYFNYSVLIPPGSGDPAQPVVPGMESHEKVPAELYFHPDGYSYAQPGKKMLLESIQIAPHDYPPSGWYGFNDAWGTLKSFKAGKVSNHTQRRIMAFLEWAKRQFPIDAEQVISVGADGAASLALNYSEAFAYVRITGFDEGVLDAKAQGGYAAVWGPRSTEIADEKGRTEWGWADLDALATAQERDLPLFSCLGYSWGRDKGYAKGNGRFYRAMEAARQPLIACWGWNGTRNLGDVNEYSAAWRGMHITRDTPVPAFSSSTLNHDQEQSGCAGGDYRWKDLKDTPDAFEITILDGRASTFELTPRRLAKFKFAPGEQLRWEALTLPGPRGEKAEPQSGTVRADQRGLVTLTGLKHTQGSPGIIVKILRQ